MINLSKFFKVKDLEFIVHDSPIFVQKYVHRNSESFLQKYIDSISESVEYLFVRFNSDKELNIYNFFTSRKDLDITIELRPFYREKFKVDAVAIEPITFYFKNENVQIIVRLKKIKQ